MTSQQLSTSFLPLHLRLTRAQIHRFLFASAALRPTSREARRVPTEGPADEQEVVPSVAVPTLPGNSASAIRLEAPRGILLESHMGALPPEAAAETREEAAAAARLSAAAGGSADWRGGPDGLAVAERAAALLRSHAVCVGSDQGRAGTVRCSLRSHPTYHDRNCVCSPPMISS